MPGIAGTNATPVMVSSQPVVYQQLKRQLQLRLAEGLERPSANGQPPAVTRQAIATEVQALLKELAGTPRSPTLAPHEQEQLIEELAGELIAAGPLEPLLLDPQITEIMVNGPQQVYVERQGRLERASVSFRDATHVMAVIERLLRPTGLSVTGSDPCLDASLPDGTRINVIIPPLVLNGPTVTIRKKSRRWTMDDLMAAQSFTPQVAEFLEACVKAKTNLIVSGGTSTGKTTLVSVLSAFIPQEERLITIENVAELELTHHEHWIRLVARNANVEGRGEIPLRTLVRNALRMRPDRIILGEARGGEALDVVQAMHTGHEGVISVLHGNSPQAALDRLETLMLMSEVDLPPQACQIQIASAIDLVIHLARYADGSRRIASMAQVLGSSSGGFEIEELFALQIHGFRPEGALEGALRYTGIRPKFLHKFPLNNVAIPTWLTSE